VLDATADDPPGDLMIDRTVEEGKELKNERKL
jgi:hypothetical protein